MLAWCFLLLAVCLPGGYSYGMYGEEIPNGDHVPHPCKANFLWHGVGHKNAQGGGDRNPFGTDFAANGRVWTEALCRKDSDGDGRSNGEELGDPDCTWRKGQIPANVQGITHPGVCDPWNEGQCVTLNSWLDCSRDVDFDCEHINEPDVRNITLRFPRTKVPAKETTYICFNFQLPDDQEYHLIATKPFIDNHNVMHHIVLSGCDKAVGLLEKPEECLMGTPDCTENIGGWTLGMTGQCIHPDAGFRIGKGYMTTASMQMHWTNPGLVDEWFDSSGLVLYFTPKLRRYNAGTLILGQTRLSIPPGQSSWVHKGTCTSRCSRKLLTGDLQVFSSLNHMHYLGIRQNITMKREGQPLMVIADDNPFNYDNPITHVHEPPITLKPGDELQTFCTFQSRSRTKTTFYGEGSYEEMCFAFLSIFPVENLIDDICIQWDDVDMCDLGERCDYRIFNTTLPSTIEIITKVLENCDATGGHCRPECPAVIEEIKMRSNCVGNMWNYVKDIIYHRTLDPYLLKFASAMDSCEGHGHDDQYPTRTPQTYTRPPTKPDDHGSSMSQPGAMLLNLVKNLDVRPLLQNIIMNVNYNYGSGHHSDDKDKADDDHMDMWH